MSQGSLSCDERAFQSPVQHRVIGEDAFAEVKPKKEQSAGKPTRRRINLPQCLS